MIRNGTDRKARAEVAISSEETGKAATFSSVSIEIHANEIRR